MSNLIDKEREYLFLYYDKSLNELKREVRYCINIKQARLIGKLLQAECMLNDLRTIRVLSTGNFKLL